MEGTQRISDKKTPEKILIELIVEKLKRMKMTDLQSIYAKASEIMDKKKTKG